MQTEATRQSDFIRPPRAGQVANVTVSTSPASQDLSLIGYLVMDMSNMDKEPAAAQTLPNAYGLIGHYITIYADGADLGVLFGATQAAVTTTNAPVFATTGVNVAGACMRIPAGQERCFKITESDRWLGVVGSAGGTARICQSSP